MRCSSGFFTVRALMFVFNRVCRHKPGGVETAGDDCRPVQNIPAGTRSRRARTATNLDDAEHGPDVRTHYLFRARGDGNVRRRNRTLWRFAIPNFRAVVLFNPFRRSLDASFSGRISRSSRPTRVSIGTRATAAAIPNHYSSCFWPRIPRPG